MNTPRLETHRLILRKFTEGDIGALYEILRDREVNTFLPWFPTERMEDAAVFFRERFAASYQKPQAYSYAVCLRRDNIPIGYVTLQMDDSYELGYGLRKEFWHQGITTEAVRAVAEQAGRDGIPYLTATHDVNNPRSGRVMQKLGMRYCYTYREQWQPKNIPVSFRLYQLNLDGDLRRVCRRYWDASAEHWVESGL